MKKIGPYAGITGITTLGELVHSNNTFFEATKNIHKMLKGEGGLKFMAGILVSSKTLSGGTNKYPNRYPPIARVPEICSLDMPHLLRTIHYNTDDPSTLNEQFDQLMGVAPGTIDAVQLNIRWASPVKLQRFRRKYPHVRIILQIGAGALTEVTEPEDIYVGSALRAYDGVVDDFLIDPSGGKGDPLDVWRAFACLADRDIPPSMRAGAAGGRNADNVRELKGLMRRYGAIVNMDAEGRLRTPRVGDEGDLLDLKEADRFIIACVELADEVFTESGVPVAA